MLVSKLYPQTINSATLYAGLTPADAEVLRTRAITPGVANARGIRTITGKEAAAYGFKGPNARPGILIPSFNTQGEVSGYQTRPHAPPMDDKGKVRKYLWPSGIRLHLDVPPDSLSVLRDVKIPIIVTESPLKGDAIQSAPTRETYCALAISGVYGWRSEGMPLSDFGDIPWRTKVHDRVTFHRSVYIAFDSDTRTNPNVTRARFEFTEFLRRKGASVRWIDVPPAADGGKQGVDDALAAGHKLDDLIAASTPAPNVMPILDALPGDTSDRVPEVDRLRAENEQLRRDNAALVQVIKNPHVAAKTKAVLVSIATEAMSKASRGDIAPGGRIRLESRHVANDHRPIPKRGESRAEVNPLDGSKPIMPRAAVASIIRQAKEQGIFRVDLVKVKKQINGEPAFWDTEIEVIPPTSLADFLSSVATYAPAEHQLRKTYTRQAPCEHCGEVHSRTQTTVCNGCGVIVGVKILEVPTAPEDELDDQIAAVESTSTKNVMVKRTPPPPASAPRNYLSTKNVEVGEPPIDSTPDPTSTKNVVPPPLPGYLPGPGEVAGNDRWTA